MTRLIAALVLISICPPRLVPFTMVRSDLGDGWVQSQGEGASETRRIVVDYVDNRNNVGDLFESTGLVEFYNLTDTPRRLKYRHSVKIPYGNYETTTKGRDFEVCASDGYVVLYIEVAFLHSPLQKNWEYSILIDKWGDLNNDGCVNGEDLGLFFGDWGWNSRSDFNKDGEINGQDLGYILENWYDTDDC